MSAEQLNTVPPPVPASPKPRKSPGLAVILSFIPGLGHIYIGQQTRGISFFAAFLASMWLSDHADLSDLIVAFLWFYAAIDAYQMACSSPPVEATQSETKWSPRANLGLGFFLILTGALILYNNFYPLDLGFLADWWPLGLIFLGIYLLAKDLRSRRQQQQPPPEA